MTTQPPLDMEAQAGPSRPRRSNTPPRSSSHAHAHAPPDAPASPETALPRSASANGNGNGAGASASPSGSRDQRMTPDPPLRLDLATYPTTTLLRLLANLLQQIAAANDQLRPDLDEYDEDEEETPPRPAQEHAASRSTSVDTSSASRASSTSRSKKPRPSPTTALFPTAPPTPPPQPAPYPDPSLFSASKASLHHPSSLLSFHARHVPSISIEAYLLRILKYCPTTNEVFLSLLVYFDRMSRLGTPAGLGGEGVDAATGRGLGRRGFAIDSYNVHRLVIAGVTVASKFFSDVFYTNSRYAKVGGLPPSELNQLELQFLLLNDFRLAIPIEEMQRYGDRLLAYSEGQGRAQESKTPVSSPARTRDPSVARDGRGRSRDRRGSKGEAERRGSKGEAEQREHAERRGSKSSIPIIAPVPAPAPAPTTTGSAVVRGASEAMEVDADGEAEPAQPPPVPSDTASVPPHNTGVQAQSALAPTSASAPGSGSNKVSPVMRVPASPAAPPQSSRVSFARPEKPRERPASGMRFAPSPVTGVGAVEGVVSGTT